MKPAPTHNISYVSYESLLPLSGLNALRFASCDLSSGNYMRLRRLNESPNREIIAISLIEAAIKGDFEHVIKGAIRHRTRAIEEFGNQNDLRNWLQSLHPVVGIDDVFSHHSGSVMTDQEGLMIL